MQPDRNGGHAHGVPHHAAQIIFFTFLYKCLLLQGSEYSSWENSKYPRNKFSSGGKAEREKVIDCFVTILRVNTNSRGTPK